MEEEHKMCETRGGDPSVIPLLLIGFCGVIGLVASASIGIPLPFTLAFVASAAVGLPCGFRRLSKRERKSKPVLISAAASVVLSPVYVPVGIALGFFAPLVPSYVTAFFTGPIR